jgi:hypothetical protein
MKEEERKRRIAEYTQHIKALDDKKKELEELLAKEEV